MNRLFQKVNLAAGRLRTMTFVREDAGADMVEYALVLALVAIVGAVALKPLGSTIASAFTNLSSSITAAM